MGRRVSNGRSSVYLGADGRWHGWVTVGVKDDGSPDRRHRTGRTEQEVSRKVQVLERQRDAGNTVRAGRAPTVEQWMTTYLDTIAVRKLAPRTLDGYRSLARNWIVPNLGKHRLDRLQPEHLDRLYTRMMAAGKASSHVLKVHRVLSRALEIAVRRGKVGRNVAKLVDAPSAGDVEITPLDLAEARKILAAVATRRNGVRWSVGLALGLRQGEALGLRWRYVDLDAGSIRVWWQLQRVTWQHGCNDSAACGAGRHREPCPKTCTRHRRGCPTPCPKGCRRHASTCLKRQRGGLVFREPKGRSKRVVQIPPELVPLLRRHKQAQTRERLTAGALWQDHDLVFCWPNGAPIDGRRDWQEWSDVLKAAGVRHVRVHDGRHTAGTLLVEQGVHVRVVQEILGHSDIRVTQRYTHVASPIAQDAAERMGRALWGP